MSKKKRNFTAPVAVLGVCAALVGGLTYYVAAGPGRQVPDELKRPDKAEQDKGGPTEGVTVLKPKFEKDGSLGFDKRTHTPSPGQDPMVAAVNEYLKGVPAVPKDAQLLSAKVEGGIAMLNFNTAFASGYGTEDEQAIVNGVLASMAQFPGVSQVQFMVDGKPLDSLGNIDLSGPQPVLKEGGLTESDRSIEAPGG